jgi:hypothetical protein
VRFPALLVVSAALSQAPLQCSRDPEPDLRRYETPPEALYGLATRFKSRGEQQAYRDTLQYLQERYPNSRYALMAKDELGATPSASSSAAPAP